MAGGPEEEVPKVYDVLAGVRVIEVSLWGFVPSAATTLADWGADVVKVVHPETGDPMQTAVVGGVPPVDDGTSFMWELANRGKRSVGIDLSDPRGRGLLDVLLDGADVFLTSLLPDARERLRIDVDDICGVNPTIVYARGSAKGPVGPEHRSGGYDALDYWGRSGLGYTVAEATGDFLPQPGPAMGDLSAGVMLAGGIAAALVRRARTGIGAVVDSSLLAAGIWANAPSVVASELTGIRGIPARRDGVNPVYRAYRTADDRHLFFSAMNADSAWEEFCGRLGRPDLVADARFGSHADRVAHSTELADVLQEILGSRPLADWRVRFDGMRMPWTALQSSDEVHADRQAVANGYLPSSRVSSGREMRTVATPLQFDGEPLGVTRAPTHAEHTDEVLGEVGLTMEELLELKIAGVIT